MPPPRNPHALASTREAILKAATRAFVRGGYRGTTMRDLAEAAGYTVPTLYSYFKNKQAILDAIVQGGVSEALAIFDEPVPEGLGLQQHLELLHLRLYAWVEAHKETVQFLSRLPEAVQQDSMKADAQFVARTVALLEAHLEALGGVDPTLAAWTLWGVGAGVFMWWLHHTPDSPLTEMAGYTVRVFLNGIRGEST